MLNDFINGYTVALLWSAADDKGNPLDPEGDAEWSIEATGKIGEDCLKFYRENSADLEAWGNDSDAGHDFALTRNHHGVGFWDRDRGELGDRLTKACDAFGEVYVYIGDDGLIYIGGA